jgi:hypothetical protein
MSLKLLLFLLMFPLAVNSQRVVFCEKVDNVGNPSSVSDRFTISKSGGYIKILVRGNQKLESKFVVFDIYSIKDKKEVFESSIRMETNPVNTWFYKELTFYKEGDFIVYVYDERDQMLGAGKVTLSFK